MNIDIDGMFVRACDAERIAYLATCEPSSEYLKEISIDFLVPNEGEEEILWSDPRAIQPIARLSGTLILGREIEEQGEDFWSICDAKSGDLEAFATEVEREGLLQSPNGGCCDMLYIYELELSSEVLEASNVQAFIGLIPRAVFLLYNVRPGLMGYLIAETEGFYSRAASITQFDSRSVDGYSPLVFAENGFDLSASGKTLFYVIEQ